MLLAFYWLLLTVTKLSVTHWHILWYGCFQCCCRNIYQVFYHSILYVNIIIFLSCQIHVEIVITCPSAIPELKKKKKICKWQKNLWCPNFQAATCPRSCTLRLTHSTESFPHKLKCTKHQVEHFWKASCWFMLLVHFHLCVHKYIAVCGAASDGLMKLYLCVWCDVFITHKGCAIWRIVTVIIVNNVEIVIFLFFFLLSLGYYGKCTRYWSFWSFFFQSYINYNKIHLCVLHTAPFN